MLLVNSSTVFSVMNSRAAIAALTAVIYFIETTPGTSDPRTPPTEQRPTADPAHDGRHPVARRGECGS